MRFPPTARFVLRPGPAPAKTARPVHRAAGWRWLQPSAAHRQPRPDPALRRPRRLPQPHPRARTAPPTTGARRPALPPVPRDPAASRISGRAPARPARPSAGRDDAFGGPGLLLRWGLRQLRCWRSGRRRRGIGAGAGRTGATSRTVWNEAWRSPISSASRSPRTSALPAKDWARPRVEVGPAAGERPDTMRASSASGSEVSFVGGGFVCAAFQRACDRSMRAPTASARTGPPCSSVPLPTALPHFIRRAHPEDSQSAGQNQPDAMDQSQARRRQIRIA